jgi:hypothetical protein
VARSEGSARAVYQRGTVEDFLLALGFAFVTGALSATGADSSAHLAAFGVQSNCEIHGSSSCGPASLTLSARCRRACRTPSLSSWYLVSALRRYSFHCSSTGKNALPMVSMPEKGHGVRTRVQEERQDLLVHLVGGEDVVGTIRQ